TNCKIGFSEGRLVYDLKGHIISLTKTWHQGPWTGFRLVLTLWSLGSLIQLTWTLHATMCISEPVKPFEGDQVSIGRAGRRNYDEQYRERNVLLIHRA
ncbi:unnamed protein product, partial [Allacma fusca]